MRAAAAAARLELDDAATTNAAAALARRAAALAPLRDVRPDARTGAVGVGAGGMPLRADAGPAYAMARPLAELVAAARAGYVLLPGVADPPLADDGTVDAVAAADALAAELRPDT